MKPVSANFEFLGKHDAQLVRLSALAERYFKDDPNTSLIKLRQFGEVLAQLTAAKTGLLASPEEPQADLLRLLKFHHPPSGTALKRRVIRPMTKKMVAATGTLRPAVMLTQEVMKKFSAMEKGVTAVFSGTAGDTSPFSVQVTLKLLRGNADFFVSGVFRRRS